MGRPESEDSLTLKFLETIGVLFQELVPTRNPEHIMPQKPVLGVDELLPHLGISPKPLVQAAHEPNHQLWGK